MCDEEPAPKTGLPWNSSPQHSVRREHSLESVSVLVSSPHGIVDTKTLLAVSDEAVSQHQSPRQCSVSSFFCPSSRHFASPPEMGEWGSSRPDCVQCLDGSSEEGETMVLATVLSLRPQVPKMIQKLCSSRPPVTYGGWVFACGYWSPDGASLKKKRLVILLSATGASNQGRIWWAVSLREGCSWYAR